VEGGQEGLMRKRFEAKTGRDKYLPTRRRQIFANKERQIFANKEKTNIVRKRISQGCGKKYKYQRSRQDRKAASKVRKTESKTWNVVFRQIDPFDNLLNKANKY